MHNHGVEYTPDNVSARPWLTVDKLSNDYNHGIKYIRIQWIDLTNIVRLRIVPLSYFMKLLQSPRPGVGIAKACLGLVYLTMAPGFTPMGEYLYALDLATLRRCPYAPGHASVMGWLHEKTPLAGADGVLSHHVDLCSRALLDRIVKESKTVSNVDFLVGFESEFILLKSTATPLEAVNYQSFAATDKLPSGKVETIVLEEIADAIERSEIELQMYHPEAAPGQYEVITGPLPPLEAADALIHTREIIRNVAAKHGLRATFAPRIYMDSAGSSAHTHISVHSPNGPPKPTEGLSSLESSFLAGVLDHLQAMPAITLPIPASYKRVTDGAWSGGTYVCWGTENRESPIRLTNATSPASRNFEMRFVDGTANPYLVLAVILAAGHNGIRTQRPLTIEDCPGPLTAAQMEQKQRTGLGITRRMPLTWVGARSNLEKSKFFNAVLGTNFITQYLSVNKVLGDTLEQEPGAETRLVECY